MNKPVKFLVHNPDELSEQAQQLLRISAGRKIFALYAPMGAGKTTLIKEFCRQLGSKDNFSSPTYSIVNEYRIPESNTLIYHIDLYRLKNLEEIRNIGMDDYLNGTDYCFIEWPGLAERMLPEDVVKITIETQDNLRIVSIFMEPRQKV